MIIGWSLLPGVKSLTNEGADMRNYRKCKHNSYLLLFDKINTALINLKIYTINDVFPHLLIFASDDDVFSAH